MSKRRLRAPFFVVNPKLYLYGQKALELAKVADELAEKYDIDILFTVQHADSYLISQNTKNLILTAQHMDSYTPGRGMGHVLPESLVEADIQAVFLNHAEHPLYVSELAKVMKRANDLELITIVCADSFAEARAIATLNPDIMVCEPTELIGTGQSSDIEYMKETNRIVKEMNPSTQVLQAAGISTVDDVLKALRSGAEGTGGTSGIVCADDPIQTLKDMLAAVNKYREEEM
ncbi:triose-phosphate isomerase [Enterococcus cecorum]|uniref:triose-phosphate isomerase n=1 Tax=Enterococcus cecorum TaxID=44008 RepID=UPI002ACAAF75|nr:triose-phosphate isomerase [Enterococcus cecorum]MDZ5588799.1 triose-phosphate isomerase [Enterococcus cecorum]